MRPSVTGRLRVENAVPVGPPDPSSPPDSGIRLMKAGRRSGIMDSRPGQGGAKVAGEGERSQRGKPRAPDGQAAGFPVSEHLVLVRSGQMRQRTNSPAEDKSRQRILEQVEQLFHFPGGGGIGLGEDSIRVQPHSNLLHGWKSLALRDQP